MKPRRFILDSTLRDGEQMPGFHLSSGQKLKIAELLDEGGVYQIEAGTPALSKQEKESIAKIIEKRKNALISVWARLMPADIQHSLELNPDLIHISVPVSYPHIYAKLQKNKNWVVKQLLLCLELAEKSGATLSVGFEDAFRSELAFMVSIARLVLEAGVERIRLSDTVGVASPSLCRTVISDFTAHFGEAVELGFHGHNDLGMAVANTLEAAKSGCKYLDVTIGGIGERAGNCNFAQLVYASNRIFDWGMSPQIAKDLQNDILKIMEG
jgi:homocitrate synthase NifV